MGSGDADPSTLKSKTASNLEATWRWPKALLCGDAEFLPDIGDVFVAGQSGFIAEMLHLDRGCRAGEVEMFVPALFGVGEVGIEVAAVEDVAGAAGVENAGTGDGQRGQRVDLALFVVPHQTLFTHGDATDAAAAALEIVEHCAGFEVHLLAQAFGDDCDIDQAEEFMGVAAQATTVEGGEDAGITAYFGIVGGGIGLMAVDMEGAAAFEVEDREGVKVVVVAAAHDGALAVLGHDEGQ